MIASIEPKLKVNSTLAVLLNELDEECDNLQTLLAQLRLPNLNNEQKGDILAELIGVISHLHVHTEELPDQIADEIETLPD